MTICVSRRLLSNGVGRLALGIAATGFMGSAALAADLPYTTKAAPAYVKQCLAMGEGFLYIPGTDTCLRVGGYVWAEGYYNTYSNYLATNNDSYSIATAGVIMDARTATEYGVLRSYIDARFKWRTSDAWSDGPNSSEIQLWDAYVQFAGLTAGHTQSFFDFYANANVLGTDPATVGSDTRLNMVAYTAEFGQGFSATLSLEDSAERGAGVLIQDPALPGALDSYQAGWQVPDIVGNLKYEGQWGTVQLSGALHQVRALTVLNTLSSEDSWGYALQAGVMFNLPTLGEGDTLYLQAAYADGAMSYLGIQDASGEYAAPDAFIGVGGLTKVSGWNVTASLLHNWNAKWSTAVFGGYASYDFDDALVQAMYGSSGGVNGNVGGYIGFTPVKNLMIALQYDWNYNKANDYVATGYGPSRGSVDASEVLLIATRDF
ncbi:MULTISPECIES: porin [unclassified Xanthobacter]|uniref:porin n=1 Tax=unclassified Xanthobacter TaxID=2623496 RepID=UPI001EE14CDC|nr:MULTISPECIES: porin [unclassified Xanthobacter]